jgi:hypothetical protein
MPDIRRWKLRGLMKIPRVCRVCSRDLPRPSLHRAEFLRLVFPEQMRGVPTGGASPCDAGGNYNVRESRASTTTNQGQVK